MKNLEEIINNNTEGQKITEDLSYDDIIQKLQEAKENDVPIEEGVLGAIAGFVGGAALGPKIGNAICKALGIDPKGTLGSLMTSRLVTTAVATHIGWKI